jgi:BON domain
MGPASNEEYSTGLARNKAVIFCIIFASFLTVLGNQWPDRAPRHGLVRCSRLRLQLSSRLKIDWHVREIAIRYAPVTSAAAAALMLGCATAHPESPQQLQADEALAGRVYAALESDPMHLYIGLDVRVRAGVTYISALTFDPSVRDAATEVARGVAGVTRVVNRVDVAAGAAP